MHLGLCICAACPHYVLSTRLVLVMHHREYTKTTGTGALALLALPNSELRLHGVEDQALDLSDLDDPERRLLLLFPGGDARLLDRGWLAQDSRPVTLVVPDGSWRQAAKMGRRLNGLDRAERVVLPAGPPTQWGLRREPRAQGFSTLEAIARALGILESEEAQAGMEALFALVVQRTLQSRGKRGQSTPIDI
ncbi:MAG: DTW domain-containing protein [Myxococcota bacterium]|jgi:DTW domain-containing protein YfiP|nr:DTW domain-containing protein [Myxococcota bacterium]